MKQRDPHTGNSLISEWLIPPRDLSLNCDEVHVWRSSLEMTPSHVMVLKQILSADEVSRAERYHFQKDRNHFIIARGLLRLILSRYLKIDPKEIRFCYGPFGKPALEGINLPLLRFNISHSRGLALFAFAQDRELGVDLEYIRSDIPIGDMSEQFFSHRELDTLNTLGEHKRQKAFFTWWTRKEAYLKVRGTGLSNIFNESDVPPATDNFADLLETQGFSKEGVPWLLRDLDAGPEYAATLVVEGREWQLRPWQCN